LQPASIRPSNDITLSSIILEGLKIILKNKLTKETMDIPYSEFRKKFAKEIQDAFES